MRKEIRAEINRANAQRSTGPKTIEGKQRSAMNAVKHNLTGQSLILQLDEMDAYNRLTNAMISDLKPKSEIERQTVQKLIDAHFRMNRLSGVENNIFNFSLIENTQDTAHDDRIEVMIAQTRAFIDHSASFNVLGRYEARLARQILQFSAELHRLQVLRRDRESVVANRQPNERYKDRFDLASFGGTLPEAVMSANSFRILTPFALETTAQPEITMQL